MIFARAKTILRNVRKMLLRMSGSYSSNQKGAPTLGGPQSRSSRLISLHDQPDLACFGLPQLLNGSHCCICSPVKPCLATPADAHSQAAGAGIAAASDIAVDA